MAPGYRRLLERGHYQALGRRVAREWLFLLPVIMGQDVSGPWGWASEGLPPDQTGESAEAKPGCRWWDGPLAL